ncbi:MAG: hypothetical protein B6226_03930 [Candidatus Cloacimonetes bacterium 4572_65]|nr:MAG: hypothetical protein B6226_03930 [Candidatus Cloacimonetes bacterium 4572_65]
MLKKITLLCLLIVGLLATVSCDRFDKTTADSNNTDQVNEQIIELFTTIDNSFEALVNNDLTPIMVNFSDNYLNNGTTKANIESSFADIFNSVQEPIPVFTLVEGNGLNVIWKLEVTSAVTDELHVIGPIVETMQISGDGFLFYGNQEEAPDGDKVKLFVEIMTATWCGSCPYVEEAVHNYELANPTRFFYLEYHTQDGLTEDMENFNSLYGLTSPPAGIIQGETILEGDQSASYAGIIDSYKDRPAELELSNFIQVDNEAMFSATVDIENLTSTTFNSENLKLRWAFYEKVSASNNAHGEPCRNVVLTEGYLDISEADIDNTVTLNIDYPRDYSDVDDLGIVLWLQTANSTYDDTSYVHTWLNKEF